MKKIYEFIANNEIKIFYLISAFCFVLFIHYNKLYHYFGHHSFSSNFVDWEFIRGFAKCNIENKNRFYDLSCDIMDRRVVYPPTWNYTPKIIYYFNSNFIFLLSVVSIFSLAAKFVTIKKISHGVLIFLIFSSPYFLYGYHRLNIDIIFLPILFVSIYFLKNNRNIISSSIIVFCSFLKIYPVAIYALFFKQKKGFFILIGVSALMSFLILFFHFDEIVIMLKNSDMAGGPGNGTFSGNNLFYFISKVFINNPAEQNPIYIFLNLILLSLIYFLIPNQNYLENDLKNLESLFFVAGFLILIFCFITSYNINYRLMYILFFLPLFFSDNFNNNTLNKKLSLIFLILFLCKGHVNTFLGNISILEYFNFIQTDISSLFKTGTTYSYYLNFIDSIFQWVMIIILVKIFKQNNFKKIII